MIIVETLRKLVWVFEFLKRDVSFKISDVESVEKLPFENVLLEFWEERGEKLMTCHLFLDNFSWNFMTFGLFSKVKSFIWNGFLFQENSNISILISWNVRLFWILSFAKDTLLQKFDCVFVLAIRGLLHMTKNFVFYLWCDFVF